MQKGRILIVDDNKSILSALEILLMGKYQEVKCISSPNLITSLNLADFDVVLLDMNFSAGINSGNEGLYWLREIKKSSPTTAVIMMTAYGDVELAVNALKEGATDFTLKPWENEKLLATIHNAFELRKTKKEIQTLKRKENQLKKIINQDQQLIIGNSKALTPVLALCQKVAKTDVNVLITGENGTGKELIARELHRLSERKEEVIVTVDMGSISESLFESELFGHLKGSFTDAKTDRIGKFEAANKGTLFLDEIGNLSLQAQAKLLSALQNRVIVKVGSNEPIPIDIRLICATNCNLEQMVADGTFREDLLYRMNTIQIKVPPLRKREKDILLLSEFFLDRFAQKYGKSDVKLNAKAEEKLLNYQWPGNVRELQHTMERTVILSDGGELMAEDFLLQAKSNVPSALLEGTLEEMESTFIQQVLESHHGNYSAAANQLGISRQTLYNKLKKGNHAE